MKVVALVILATITACSVEHRSGDYTCTRQADCTGNRRCVDGFCIDPSAPDAAGSDARPGTPDANTCPSVCTSCDPEVKACTILCTANNCTGTVICPPGWNCDIQCGRDNSCRNGIDCQSADSCTITCSGQQACRGIQCGFGRCDVTCTGQQSCRGIDCGVSCACDVACIGQESCGDAVVCPLGCDPGLGCTSAPLGCDGCL